MKKFIIPGILIIVIALALVGAKLVLQQTPAATSGIAFADQAFAKTWNAVDKAVLEQAGAGRGYTWGPLVAGGEALNGEPYNGGYRKVQYFEKARMEINNPAGNQNNLYYVTTGLLVKELVTGLRQDGEDTFSQLTPSTIQVAGDPNDGNANVVAPTYASFKDVVTFFGNQNSKPAATGSAINATIAKNGTTGTSASPPENRLNGSYDAVTGHNIADVFADYGKTNGKVWSGSAYLQGPVFYGDPTYVLGRPVSEPYWTRAVVGGVEKDVLVQLFERRALTYTPSNPDGFQVEMGNVGQHYFKWRYLINNSPVITLPATTAANTPVVTTAAPATTAVITAANALSVNFGVDKNVFDSKMLGVNFVNWDHSWGKPYPNEINGLVQALKAAKIGLIRYAGGNWSNTVGWDRNDKRNPYDGWPDGKNGPYWFQYNPAEIDSVARLAKALGAEVMVEVNISTSDPAMWADMVKYTNVEHNYGFKYWELGNELDADKEAPGPDEYAKRVGLYLDALLAVDSKIQVMVAGVATPYDSPRIDYSDSNTDLSQYLTKGFAVTSPKGNKAKALSYHWYQACNSKEAADLQRYSWSDVPDNSWRNNYARKQADVIGPRIINEITKGAVPQGVSELNFDACNFDSPMNGNFLNALWTADVLGRMAYNGDNFAVRYQGYGTQSYSLLYPDSGDSPGRVYARPAYYSFLMYANYFGNQMVESHTFDNERISIWAARDTADPSKLKLMVTNLSGSDISTPVNIAGFNAASGEVYQLKSAKPTDISNSSLTASASINGVTVDAMNVAGSLASIKPVGLTVAGGSFNYTFPAYTTTAIVLTK